MTLPLPVPSSLPAGRFRLRRYASGDASLDLALARTPDVPRWTFFPPDLTPEGAAQRVERSLKGADAGTGCRFVVLDGDEVLGTAGVIEVEGIPSLSYALLESGRGRGAATAAVLGLVDWLAANGRPVVELSTIVGNTASESVARRAGFVVDRAEHMDRRGEELSLQVWRRSS